MPIALMVRDLLLEKAFGRLVVVSTKGLLGDDLRKRCHARLARGIKECKLMTSFFETLKACSTSYSADYLTS